MGGTCGTHGGGKCTRCWWERDNLEDQVVDGRILSEWILGRFTEGALSGSSWLRIGTDGGLL
jgi:hypothetical protein